MLQPDGKILIEGVSRRELTGSHIGHDFLPTRAWVSASSPVMALQADIGCCAQAVCTGPPPECHRSCHTRPSPSRAFDDHLASRGGASPCSLTTFEYSTDHGSNWGQRRCRNTHLPLLVQNRRCRAVSLLTRNTRARGFIVAAVSGSPGLRRIRSTGPTLDHRAN